MSVEQEPSDRHKRDWARNPTTGTSDLEARTPSTYDSSQHSVNTFYPDASLSEGQGSVSLCLLMQYKVEMFKDPRRLGSQTGFLKLMIQ